MYLTCRFPLFISIFGSSPPELHASQPNFFVFIYVLEHTHAPLLKWMDLLQSRPLSNCWYPRKVCFCPHCSVSSLLEGTGTHVDLQCHINRQISSIRGSIPQCLTKTGDLTKPADCDSFQIHWKRLGFGWRSIWRAEQEQCLLCFWADSSWLVDLYAALLI